MLFIYLFLYFSLFFFDLLCYFHGFWDDKHKINILIHCNLYVMTLDVTVTWLRAWPYRFVVAVQFDGRISYCLQLSLGQQRKVHIEQPCDVQELPWTSRSREPDRDLTCVWPCTSRSHDPDRNLTCVWFKWS